MGVLSRRSLLAGVALGFLAYASAIALLTWHPAQRAAFYANHVNPAYFQNLSNVEQFGFLHHQVQPFTVKTSDGIIIYAWHILPTHLYLQHERALKSQQGFGIKSSAEAVGTVGLKLLAENSNAHVVVSFHGNAAHLGSGCRPTTYQQMLGLSTPERPVHVIAFDYRGFGLSTGSPTEQGIIEDGMAIMSFLTGLKCSSSKPDAGHSLQIPPNRIMLLGQSLGTATSTALFHTWTLTHHLPPFRGIILMASFGSVPTLLLSYSIKGVSPPLLAPLNFLPGLQTRILSTIHDTWRTDRRIMELITHPGVKVNLGILHAQNDGDIPWREGWRNLEAAVLHAQGRMLLGEEDVYEDENRVRREWESFDRTKRVRWEKVLHGGHNRVASSEQAKLAVLRILDAD